MSIALRDVVLRHPGGARPALRGVSLRVEAGTRVAVIGPSGAGKTSLLRLAATSVRPSDGAMSVLGQDPWSLRPAALRSLRARIGTVHQAPPIPPRLRVVTAVLAGRLGDWSTARALASLWRPADAEGAHAALVRLDLGDRLFERCDRLSGGELQRVGIARVLYQAPALILADEPVSALDPTLADMALRELVAQSRTCGATLVASLHAVDLALRWFDRIVGLRGGELFFDAPSGGVSAEMLQALYANEGGVPTLGTRAHEDGIDDAEPFAERRGPAVAPGRNAAALPAQAPSAGETGADHRVPPSMCR
ncbi:MAG: ATP-binding cassette domain-containing protein [Comamonadaceae bacterium]|nr:MAG: ATP-binding cassette domain-containing protein [Comamonadaceae bacterium]